MSTELKTLAALKRHEKKTGGSFFSAGNTRVFGSSRVWGIYRAPYMPLDEGYIITEAIFTGSDGVAAPAEYPLYRFTATPDGVEWYALGRHASLDDAEAFLQAMGAVTGTRAAGAAPVTAPDFSTEDGRLAAAEDAGRNVAMFEIRNGHTTPRDWSRDGDPNAGAYSHLAAVGFTRIGCRLYSTPFIRAYLQAYATGK